MTVEQNAEIATEEAPTILSRNLRYFMKLKGIITATHLAQIASLPQPTVHHILSGATKKPHSTSLIALAKALSVSIVELVDMPLSELDKMHTRPFTILPLLQWDEATKWPLPTSEHPHVVSKNNIYTDINVGTGAFALIMRGSSMEPLFPEGCVLVVDPTKPPKDKCFVVVHLNNEPEVAFKQLLLDGSHGYLKSLNPHFNNLEPLAMSPSDRIVGVAAQVRFNLE